MLVLCMVYLAVTRVQISIEWFRLLFLTMKQFVYFSVLVSIMLVSFGSCSKDDDSVSVESVTLNKSILNLIEDESETLFATVAPSNSDNKACLWDSSDPYTATVSESGKVTAVRKGEATITVTTVDGGKKASCRVVVEAKYIAVNEIRLSETSAILHVGESHKLTAILLPEDATNKSITWKSADDTVASVDSQGVINAHKTGKTTITASAENGTVNDICEVMVEPVAVSAVSISDKELKLIVGEEYQLVLEITPANANDKSAIWFIEDQSIAKVDDNGKVTALKTGRTTVTVRTNDGGYTDRCVIEVVEITELITGKTGRVGSVFINGVEFPSNNLTISIINNSNHSITLNSVQIIEFDTGRNSNVIDLGGIELKPKQEYWDVLSNSRYWDEPVIRWRYSYNGMDYVFDCGLTQ